MKRLIKRWKELREVRYSVKDTIIQIIKENTTDRIKWKLESSIIRRYGKDSFFLKNILDDNKDKYDYQWDYKHITFLYSDVMEGSKEEAINKHMVAVKLLFDYSNMVMYLSHNLKTSARTDQYYNAHWKLYRETRIFSDWGECIDDKGMPFEDGCPHCNKFIKQESDKIRKALQLRKTNRKGDTNE